MRIDRLMPRAGFVAAAAVLMYGLATQAQTPTFTDQTAAAGLTMSRMQPTSPGGPASKEMPGGGCVFDFNNDGWQDVFGLGMGTYADKLFVNNGDGTFTDVTAVAGLDVIHRGIGAAAGDYDNDGWVDLYVTSWGEVATPGPGAHKLYRNNGDGTFTDVAVSAGVNTTSPSMFDGMSAAFGDYDHDGDLDLAVTAWFQNSLGNKLFRNNGDGTFTDVITTAVDITMIPVYGFAPGFHDMNGDRYPELLWVADFFTSKYLVNNTDGTFTDMTGPAGTGIDSNGMGQTIDDFDNDGDFDWYVSSIYSKDGVNDHFGNMFYVNQGNDTFVESGQSAGLFDGGWGWGMVSEDFNHDGWVDIIECNGWPGQYGIEREYYFHNNGDLTFTEMGETVGITFDEQGRGIANFDYDRDGDQDVVMFPWNYSIILYRNDLDVSRADTHWLHVTVDTNGSDTLAPNGIGTLLIATVGGESQHRYISGASNYLSQSELAVHFGLGSATTVDELLVQYADGSVRTLCELAADQHIVIYLPGDLDGSGEIGLEDHADIVETGCFNGPDGPIGPACKAGDLDDDCDVDLRDVGAFQNAFEGA